VTGLYYTLTKKAGKSYKSLVRIYQATQCQISEGSNSATREKFETLKGGTAFDTLARTQMFDT